MGIRVMSYEVVIVVIVLCVSAFIFIMQTIFRDIIIAMLIIAVTIPSAGYITGEAIDTLWGKYGGASDGIEYIVEDGEVVADIVIPIIVTIITTILSLIGIV